MLTYVYQFILAVVVLLIIVELFTQKKFALQATTALALIPLLLRLFMIG